MIRYEEKVIRFSVKSSNLKPTEYMLQQKARQENMESPNGLILYLIFRPSKVIYINLSLFNQTYGKRDDRVHDMKNKSCQNRYHKLDSLLLCHESPPGSHSNIITIETLVVLVYW